MKTKFLLLCLLAISPLCKADFLPVNLKVNGLALIPQHYNLTLFISS